MRGRGVAERRTRVLAIASGGGHWVQLLRLRPAFDGCDVSFATVHADSAADVDGAPFYTFRDASRADWWNFAPVAWQLARVLWRVRPDVVVTTGAMPPLAAIVLGRLSGARTLWIDSVANSERLSSSGRIARAVAHCTVTQWPGLATAQVPCWGSVL